MADVMTNKEIQQLVALDIEQQIRDATRELTKLDMRIDADKHTYFVIEGRLREWQRLLTRRRRKQAQEDASELLRIEKTRKTGKAGDKSS